MEELILSYIGLFFSILFSASEIALISANPLQIGVWIKQGSTLSKIGQRIINQKEAFLFLILMGTTISNILTTSFATIYFLNQGLNEISIILFISIIILIFGEVLPKTFIRNHANIGLVYLSPFLIIFYYIFSPIILLTVKLKLLKWYKKESELEKRRNLEYSYEHLDDEETMEREQQKMISNVLDFNKLSVKKTMTPRTDISAISIDETLEKAMYIFMDSGHSKLPVYKENIDNVIGMIYLYDLFKSPENLQNIIKDILFIPHTKSILELIPEFQKANYSLAIVLDEHGKTVGLITAQNILEELFGNFKDEFDIDKNQHKEISKGIYLVNAKMNCKDFNNIAGDVIPQGNYETIAGYIISDLGRIPHRGEHFFTKIGHIIIKKASARYIEQVMIYLENNNEDD